MPNSLRSTESVRALVVADAEALYLLDTQGNYSPWTANQFRQSLDAGDLGFGVEICRELVAYALFNCVLDEATLLNLSVRPDCRRRGLAKALLQAGMVQLASKGIARLLLEVRDSNQAAITLYRALGFQIDGVRRGYYPLPQGREDGLLMSVALKPAASRGDGEK